MEDIRVPHVKKIKHWCLAAVDDQITQGSDQIGCSALLLLEPFTLNVGYKMIGIAMMILGKTNAVI